jgi:hypothetical protein
MNFWLIPFLSITKFQNDWNDRPAKIIGQVLSTMTPKIWIDEKIWQAICDPLTIFWVGNLNLSMWCNVDFRAIMMSFRCFIISYSNIDSDGILYAYFAIILYIQRSPDSAVTGPVEMGPIPMRATASTGGSKPRLYCHRSTQYIVRLCRWRHSCQRGTNTIALLCLLC